MTIESQVFLFVYAVFSLISAISLYFKLNKWLLFNVFIVFSFFLIVFSGFNTKSPDYIGYLGIINSVGNFFDLLLGSAKDLHGDYLFFLIASIVNTLTSTNQIVFIIVSFLSVGITSFVIYSKSNYPLLSILLFSSHNYLNKDAIQIRAALCSAFLVLAIYYMSQQNNKRAFLSFFASIFSHSSGLISIVPIIIYKVLKANQLRKCMCFALVVAIIFQVSGGFFGFISYFEFLLPQGLKNYIGWDIYNYSLGFFNISSIRAFVISICIIYYFEELSRCNFNLIASIFYIVGACLLLAFSDFAILAGRLSSILLSVEVILLVNLFHMRPLRQFRIVVFIYALIMLANNFLFSDFDLGVFYFDLI